MVLLLQLYAMAYRATINLIYDVRDLLENGGTEPDQNLRVFHLTR